MKKESKQTTDNNLNLNYLFTSIKFTDKEPGTIVADFDGLLRYFIDNQIEATGKTLSLPLKTLSVLNSLLTIPAVVRFKRPQIKSYPHVRGIFWLLRGSGLLVVRHIDKQKVFKANLEKCRLWKKLNAIEKYFYLLELWWFRCSKELIEDKGWRDSLSFFDLLHYWRNFSKKKELVYKDYEDYHDAVYFHGSHNIALHSLFGLVDIEEFESKEETGWGVKKIILNKWGQSVITLVNNSVTRKILEKNLDLFAEVKKPGITYKLFGKYFPDWKFIDFPKPARAKMKGTLVFKVSLYKWSARIAISASNTWEDLNFIILKAVGFDDTMHLYDFDIIDDTGIHHRFIRPEGEKMDSSDQFAYTEIGKTWMEKGQEITYTFDYGDDWKFRLVLEEIKDEKLSKPKILAAKGNPPEQYPYEDE